VLGAASPWRSRVAPSAEPDSPELRPKKKRRGRYRPWALAGTFEPTELPPRSPDRGPPYWASTILRRKALGYHDA
jgi:hypothetical protein